MKLFSRYILLWSKKRLVVNCINITRAAYVAETRRKQKGTIRTQIYLYYNTYIYIYIKIIHNNNFRKRVCVLWF